MTSATEKPTLPINGLVISCADRNEGVWLVHSKHPDRVGSQFDTYHTEKIANGVAGRRKREGYAVLGVYAYTSTEVRQAYNKSRHAVAHGLFIIPKENEND